MASSKEYPDYISEQLSESEEITYRAMMGEYILYENMSDDELMEEREKARLAHCFGNEEGTRTLDIDNILRKRDTTEPTPHADPNFRWTEANRWDRD